MTLRELFAQRKSALCERWLDAILADYGEQTAALWRRERDRFANPIGHILSTELPRIVEVVSSDGDLAAASAALEAIIQIRSVQDLAPSRAVAFVYLLRDVVRSELAPKGSGSAASFVLAPQGAPSGGGSAASFVLAEGALAAELAGLDRRIELLALLAFDVYVQCRERLFRLRLDELKRSVASLLRRWNMGEIPEPGPAAMPRAGTSPRPTPLPILTGER